MKTSIIAVIAVFLVSVVMPAFAGGANEKKNSGVTALKKAQMTTKETDHAARDIARARAKADKEKEKQAKKAKKLKDENEETAKKEKKKAKEKAARAAEETGTAQTTVP
ncbi:MAG: hypothetical protein PHS37_09000 [Candidatus Omnitrophica bacterium]|nr:hypothetical protein [Candidatus Omnitrophota bacterium]